MTVELLIRKFSNGTHGDCPTVVLIDGMSPPVDPNGFAEALSRYGEIFLSPPVLPLGPSMDSYVDKLVTELTTNQRLKRFNVFGVGVGALAAQILVLRYPKFVRRLLLLDPAPLPRKGWIEKCVYFLERVIPQGLPFRRPAQSFDHRFTLHRIRCPTLLLFSPQSTPAGRRSGADLFECIPNCWKSSLTKPIQGPADALSGEFVERLAEFLEVPIKMSQARAGSDSF